MSEVALREESEVVNYSPQLIDTLRNSMYPGAKTESIIMVLEYCRHAKIDVMQKPVHIVPMWVVDKKTNKGEMRDILMHSIGYYRIQASRSGCAGISEPEFGEDVTECLGGVDVTYPKWCRVTVKRIIAGKEVEFTAKEYWKENYATGGKDKTNPNAMWLKRPYGQLAKCAESQALRKGFPEIGTMPTAEEMEGKQLSSDEYEEINKKQTMTATDKLKAKLGLAPAPEPATVTEVDPETGEVFEGEVVDDNTPKTVEQITFLMESATSLKQLLEVAEYTKSLSDAEKTAMRVVFKRCEAQFKNKV